MSFLGHLHPSLVHLPIGGLVLLGFLEFLSSRTRWKDAAQNSRWVLGFVSLTCLLSAAYGWVLAKAGGYDSQLLKWHQAAGFCVAGTSVITLLLRCQERIRAYRVSLFSSLLVLAVAGHLGGSIALERDFLTHYVPAPVREFFGGPITREDSKASAWLPLQQPLFAGYIEPILQQRCSDCHGAEKHKADLRLDTFEGLLRGGQDGPVIKAGQANDSPLIQCMASALDADGHMPPEDHPQPTPEEIALIEWWVNHGAPPLLKVVDLKPEAEIQRLVESLSKR